MLSNRRSVLARRAILVALLGLLLASCDWAPIQYRGLPGPGEPAKTTVYAHGDSLSVHAHQGPDPSQPQTLITDMFVSQGYAAQGHFIVQQHAANGVVATDNWPGSGVAVPDVYVFALGSNDMGMVGSLKDPNDPAQGTWTLEERLGFLDTYINQLHALGVKCIAAFNLPSMSTAWNLDVYAASWNDLLENHPYVDHVEDWATTAEANPQEFDGPLIHFDNGVGDPMPAAYRAHYSHAVDTCAQAIA